jgi:segregation and condensation protein A
VTDPVASATAARVAAEDVAAWEDPPRAARSAAAPVLSVEGFAGPLGWLLAMARAKKLDLAKLSIAALIEAFVPAMQAGLAGRHAARNGHWAVWTVMAATLTELWSRLLLPADSREAKAAQAEAEALRQQLLNRARMRGAADRLERRPQLRRDVFALGRPELALGGWGRRSHRTVVRLPGRAARPRSRCRNIWPPAAAALARHRRAGAHGHAARRAA